MRPWNLLTLLLPALPIVVNGCAMAAEPEDSALASSASERAERGIHAEFFNAYHDRVFEGVGWAVDFDWRSEAPLAGVTADRFSARFTGKLTPTRSGRTTFIVDADDGTRLWVDGRLVIDDWRGHFVERHTAEVELTAGRPVDVRLEYFELDLAASLKLSWKAPGLAEQIIPGEAFTSEPGPTGLAAPKPPISNPVIPRDCPDPGVVSVPGVDRARTYYNVCTGGTIPIRSSRDLVSWTDVPNAWVLPAGKPPWAANGHRNWAPEIHRVGNDYLAYYTTVNGANVLSIGVASAPTPTGPWTDRGSPLAEHPAGAIDPNFFEDEDGSRWLFWKIDGNSRGEPTPILVRRLSPDGLSFAPGSRETQTITNDRNSWEGGVVEGSWVVKHDGRYYMFYSGNVYNHLYRTGVARASSLTGPWEKKGAPILANNSAWVGPGHGSVVRVPRAAPETGDVDYFVYHAWRNSGNGTELASGGRQLLIDRIDWANGWPRIGNGTPTTGSQAWPGEAL